VLQATLGSASLERHVATKRVTVLLETTNKWGAVEASVGYGYSWVKQSHPMHLVLCLGEGAARSRGCTDQDCEDIASSHAWSPKTLWLATWGSDDLPHAHLLRLLAAVAGRRPPLSYCSESVRN
jgi:hypothetical protein